VIADESVYTAQDALSILRAGGADVLSIYVGKSAGIGPARKTAAIAEAAMAGCTVGSNLEMGIGSAAMIHLALSTPGITADEFPCDILRFDPSTWIENNKSQISRIVDAKEFRDKVSHYCQSHECPLRLNE